MVERVVNVLDKIARDTMLQDSQDLDIDNRKAFDLA
jgi:hypothetical protein